MNSAQAERLIRVLGMLGSDYDGEVLAAGRAADQLVRASGHTWQTALAPLLGDTRDSAPASATCDWHDVVDACLRHPHRLNAWESNFLLSLQERQSDLTEKQAAKLSQIARKCGVRFKP